MSRPIEPLAVVQHVEQYVDRELQDAEKYDNRDLLDESGIWSLHELAAKIYAQGYADGQAAESERSRHEARRARYAATRGQRDQN